jgi:hypothetical protein
MIYVHKKICTYKDGKENLVIKLTYILNISIILSSFLTKEKQWNTSNVYKFNKYYSSRICTAFLFSQSDVHLHSPFSEFRHVFWYRLCYVKPAIPRGMRNVYTFLFKVFLLRVVGFLTYSWVTFFHVFLFLQNTLLFTLIVYSRVDMNCHSFAQSEWALKTGKEEFAEWVVLIEYSLRILNYFLSLK